MGLHWISKHKMGLLLAGMALLHFALGGLVGLSVDEAHYALYATHLALSYFDHPPLVGWVQWPLVALDAPVVLLRLVPELLWLASLILASRLAERITGGNETGKQAAWWTLLVLVAAPMLHVLGIGLLPDTLLMFFTIAIMVQTSVLMDANELSKPAPWLLLGLLLGLAGLSKYTAIFAALAVAVCLWWAHGLRVLRSPWPWVAVAVALVVVSPVLVWNAQNGWISFSYQAKHGAGSAWRISSLLEFLVLQVVVFGPLLWWAWGRRAMQADVAPVLRVFFVIPFLVLAAMSGGGSSLPHWTAPAWVALAPFAGIGLAQAVQTTQRNGVWLLLALQGVVAAAVLALMVSGGVPFASGKAGARADQPNPMADLHGWEQAGSRARALAHQQGLTSVGVQNWTLASRLGWYARPLPVLVLEDRFDQFDLWAGDLPVGGDTLLVDWSQMAYEVPLGAHGFRQCDLLDTQGAQRMGATLSTFRFYACRGWAADPKPQLIQPE
jgi:hypothetical protein